jgi:hypothetical protein
MAEDIFDTVVIIDGAKTWAREFSWELIGQHFQKGYEAVNTDWVFHLDTDFFFHEKDKDKIRQACIDHHDQPALNCYKWQFILPDRYNLKSRLVLGVNKQKFGNRIKFNSGGDLAQPSLDGEYIQPDNIKSSGVEFYNYEKLIKTEAQVKDDVERMARAWQRYFGEYKLGTTETAYAEWLKMVVGRFAKPQRPIRLDEHPKYIQQTIRLLKPEQWGYNGFNNMEINSYAQDFNSSR